MEETIVDTIGSVVKSYLVSKGFSLGYVLPYSSSEGVVVSFTLKDVSQVDQLLSSLPKLEDILNSLFDTRVLFDFVNYKPLPSRLEVLRQLKVVSPANIDALLERLNNSSSVVEMSWLKTEINSLRKFGLIAWISTGQYIVTQTGMSLLGSTLGRGSSDVERILALSGKPD